MLAHRLGDGRWQLCLLGSLGLQVTGKPTQSGSNNKNLYYFIKKKKTELEQILTAALQCCQGPSSFHLFSLLPSVGQFYLRLVSLTVAR